MSDAPFVPFHSDAPHVNCGGGLLYYPGTESITCNRCGNPRSIWNAIRISWTAVCWECLNAHEKGQAVRQPEAILPIIPPHMVFENQRPEPLPDKEEGEDDEEPDED